MSDRMTDERLAELVGRTWDVWYGRGARELLGALVAERAEVDRLGEALDLCQDSPASDETSEVLIECNRLEERVVRLEAALTDLTAMIDDANMPDDPASWESHVDAALARAAAVLAEGATT